MMVVVGFVNSWISGLLKLAVTGIAVLLLLRLLRKEMDWQTKVFGAIGFTFLACILSIGADFVLLR
ncbi:hypothetical protein [Hymenobacter sedentarius]|nr:hypothetical protein [Hymenobacter sedentarius]